MLFRKMLRDMKQHKTQFISIFLMAFLGVYIYSGVGGDWHGLKKIVDKYYSDTNLSDIWIYSKGFSKEDIEKIEKLTDVKEAQGRMSIEGIGDFDNNPSLKLNFLDEDKISKNFLVEGEEFSVDKEGIWLDYSFAKEKKLKIGDEIKVSYYGASITEKIKGTIYNPEYVYFTKGNDMIPNHNNYGFAYLSYKSLPAGFNIVYTDLLVTSENKNYSALEDEIDKTLNGKYSVIISREDFPSFTMFDEEIQQHKAMGQVFPIVFLGIAVLTIVTTMSRLVNSQRTQIGTLKALGFKRRQILFHYISYGFWLPLLGAALGAILGPISLPFLFYRSLKTTYTLPEWKPGIALSFGVVALISVTLCVIATYLTCMNVLKDTPSETLRPKAPKIMKQNIISKTKLWNKLGFNAQWNFRDISRSKIRSIMGIVGVMGCMALLVCAFGLQNSLDDMSNWQYRDIYRFDSKLELEENINEQELKNIIDYTNGEVLMEGAIEVKVNGAKKSGTMLVTDDTTLIKYTDKSRRFIDLPKNGISISYKLANLLGVKIGDKVEWHIYGEDKWVYSKVSEIYRVPISQGVVISKDDYDKLGYDYKATSVITSEKVSGDLKGVNSKWTREQLIESYDTLSEAMNTLVYICIFAAALLAIVVLYNLGVISFVERERELATLKVIGFKRIKIAKLLLTQTIILTILGMIIGAPIGKALIEYMCSFLGDDFDMMVVINPSSIIYSIIITLGLSIIVNLMFSRKIKDIDMVSSLKGVE